MNKHLAQCLVVLALYAAGFGLAVAVGYSPTAALLVAALAIAVNVGGAAFLLALVYLLSRALP